MREQFEKLPEIARIIHTYDALFLFGKYSCEVHHMQNYLNGAIYAYQEQQRKIDTVLKAIEWHIEDCGIGEDTEYNKAWLEAMLFVKQELLR